MKLQRSIMTVAGLALALAPAVVRAEQAASPAGKLSVSRSPALANQVQRTGAPVARTSELGGRSAAALFFGAVAVGLLVLVATHNGHHPHSP